MTRGWAIRPATRAPKPTPTRARRSCEELRQHWGVETGQVWTLGKHRLLCGDSTKAEDVTRLLGRERPHLMVTDPPYGVEYDADWRNRALRTDGTPIGGRATGKVTNDDRADWSEAWALFQGDVAYVWHAGSKSPLVAESLVRSGFDLRSLIVWAKSHFVIGRGHYHPQHEPCCTASARERMPTGWATIRSLRSGRSPSP